MAPYSGRLSLLILIGLAAIGVILVAVVGVVLLCTRSMALRRWRWRRWLAGCEGAGVGVCGFCVDAGLRFFAVARRCECRS